MNAIQSDQEYLEWEQSLFDCFNEGQVIGQVSVQKIADREKKVNYELHTSIPGQSVLSESLLTFCQQSLQEVKSWVSETATEDGNTTYRFWVARQLATVNSLRACDNLFWEGYTYQAMGLLRGVRESVLLSSAVLNQKTDVFRLFGLNLQVSPNDKEKIRKAAEAEEKRVLRVLQIAARASACRTSQSNVFKNRTDEPRRHK
jgi:hypothetical protein